MKRIVALFLAFVLLVSMASIALADGTYSKAAGNFSYRNGISFGMTSAEVAAVEAKNGLNGNGEDYDKVQKVGQRADKEYFFDELGYFYFVGDGNGNITSMSIDIDSYADQLNDGIYSSIKYQYDDNGGLSVITHTFPYFTVSANLYNTLVADLTAEFGSPDYGTKLNSQSPVSIMTKTSETSYTVSDTYKNNLFVVFSTLGIGNFKIIEQNTWCVQYENGGVMIDAFCVRMGADTDQYHFYFPILTYHAVSQDFMDTHFKTAKNVSPTPDAIKLPVSGRGEEEFSWIASDDHMLEVKLVSIAETTYPNFQVQVIFRLDGITESEIQTVDFDFSSSVSEYIAKNPAYKNRKIKVSSNGQFINFRQLHETTYSATLEVWLNGTDRVLIDIPFVDLAYLYPDEFVNPNIMYAGTILRKLKTHMKAPDSFSLSHACVIPNTKYPNDYTYYAFQYSATNALGGSTSELALGVWDSKTGHFDIWIGNDRKYSELANREVSAARGLVLTYSLYAAYGGSLPDGTIELPIDTLMNNLQ